MIKSASIHEALKPVEWLAGKWITDNGKGQYPGIPSFEYHETLNFECVGQPMYNYQSESWHPITNNPMHQERGFLRINPGTKDFSMMVAHNFGLTTIEEGSLDEETKGLVLRTSQILRMSFAKQPNVQAIERRIKLLAPGSLEVVTSMETDKQAMCEHLRATYVKTE